LETIYVKNGSETATVWSRNAFDTDVELSAVSWVGVSSVVTGLVAFTRIWADKSFGNFSLIATFDKVGPDADTLVLIVSQTGWAVVLGRFTVPTRVEDATVGRVFVDSVQTGAMRSAYWWFKIGSVAARNGEWVSAIFAKRIGIVKNKTVTANLEGRVIIVASPISIATSVVRIEAKGIGTLESLGRSGSHQAKNS
jgi:hypothetical protein